MRLSLLSSAFPSGGAIPRRHTCEGENLSPPLRWSRLSEEVRSLVLLVEDPEAAAGGTFCHWVLYNIPPDREGLPEGVEAGGALPWGAMQGRNDFGNLRYEGPCPPLNTEHTYYFRLYALDAPLDIAAGATRDQVVRRMEGHILEQAELVGRYGRR
jgi:Raf kinase inhibitor-like YbhB/YbcL family protein